MWKLYDDLCIGIPSGITVDSCAVGDFWTAVRANGNIGIARTSERPADADAFAARCAGRYLRDIGNHMHWRTAAEASVGVAALNAWYNTAERVKGLDGNAAPRVLSGRVAYVGDYAERTVFPMPSGPDFDADRYKALADYDSVVIASEALVTRALPALLDIIGEDGDVVLEGYSLPASALFFAFDMPIRELRGFYPSFVNTVDACARKNISDPAPGALPFCISAGRVKR
jgi:uncharacterized protein (DUF4213/DUF364 family)